MNFPGKRECPECPGLEFVNMEEHADHLATHNPTGDQWVEAYKRIQLGKEGKIVDVPPVNEELRAMIRDRKAGIR